MAGRGGRNDDAICEALGMIVDVPGGSPNAAGISANRQLGEFQRNNPMLFKADDWWVATRAELDVDGVAITWAVFRREFMRRYFLEDVQGIEEIDFLELKQCNMTVPEYASKFVELAKYYTHYNNDDGKKPMDKSKPYGKGNPKAGGWKRPSGGESSAPVRCYRCGEAGHHIHECKSEENKCYRCGKAGHVVADCKGKTVTCYNCGEEGHVSPQCTKTRKNQSGGEVFALSGSETTHEDRLMKAVGVEDLAMTAR
ncbi:uncharacterized protein LOC131646968 [Vicia villosa]|uniref:uncharacterized protein LOC131646968 n=1 Tax=Vicia villosa TaxID=3911 RepID=UPI00273CAC65|nr:uncharacterized protein LOC131646968 [Vicia villosa]